MIARAKKVMYILAVLFVVIFYGITFAQDNPLLDAKFKLADKRDKAKADIQKIESDIQKCEKTIMKSENIIKLAQQQNNKQAEMDARTAFKDATEAKRKNEDIKKHYELRKISTEKAYARIEGMLKKEGNKKLIVELPPYFSEGAPPVNCEEGLKNLNSKDYYCEKPNRPPLKRTGGQEVGNKEEMNYAFYYSGEVQTMSGLPITIEGIYFGRHKSYEEAFKACENEAGRCKKLHGTTDHFLSLECRLQFLDGKPIY